MLDQVGKICKERKDDFGNMKDFVDGRTALYFKGEGNNSKIDSIHYECEEEEDRENVDCGYVEYNGEEINVEDIRWVYADEFFFELYGAFP